MGLSHDRGAGSRTGAATRRSPRGSTVWHGRRADQTTRDWCDEGPLLRQCRDLGISEPAHDVPSPRWSREVGATHSSAPRGVRSVVLLAMKGGLSAEEPTMISGDEQRASRKPSRRRPEQTRTRHQAARSRAPAPASMRSSGRIATIGPCNAAARSDAADGPARCCFRWKRPFPASPRGRSLGTTRSARYRPPLTPALPGRRGVCARSIGAGGSRPKQGSELDHAHACSRTKPAQPWPRVSRLAGFGDRF